MVLGMIISGIIFIGLLIVGVITSWKTMNDYGVLWAALTLVSVMFFMGYYEGVPYKLGQIDAINGIVKYEKVVQPNGEVLWEKIDEEL